MVRRTSVATNAIPFQLSNLKWETGRVSLLKKKRSSTDQRELETLEMIQQITYNSQRVTQMKNFLRGNNIK